MALTAFPTNSPVAVKLFSKRLFFESLKYQFVGRDASKAGAALLNSFSFNDRPRLWSSQGCCCL